MKKLILLTLLMTSGYFLSAQVTTAALGGLISDTEGSPLIGATVLAVHTPTGSEYGVITFENGRYTIKNMKVGGPYTVTISYIGYATTAQENVYLELGQKLNVDFVMMEEGITADEIVVTAALDPILNGERTGAETSINSDMINKLPTISRSAADYTRLNAMSAEGGSFAGRNDQFNNYSLDGSIFNNPFGLDAATPGGQTDAQPVSLDAIEQINVSIAPYDVTQSGFTGAAINAVTKSGTNDFKGTVYGFFRNKNFIGSKVRGDEVIKGDLSQLQTGFALGGPIVKNKVFFFANFELENRSDLGSYFIPDDGSGSVNASRVLASDMQRVKDLLMSVHGYDAGAISGFKHDSDNKKGLFKLDFNLSQNHKLTATYNFLDAFKDKPAHPSAIGRRGPDFQTLQFQNSGYRINNTLHQGKIELKSFMGSKYSNKFSAAYTQFRDSRDPFSAPFPVLNIGKDGVRYIIAGHEPFSISNVLDQDVIQITNDFNIYSGSHTFTVGTAFEKFDFNNSFNLTGYGFRVFGPDVDIADIEDVIRSQDFANEVAGARDAFAANNALPIGEGWALAETNLGQWSVYLQDEYQASDKLNLTFGIRMDMPLYFDTPSLIQENIDRKGGTIANGGVYAPDVVYYDEDANPVTFDHTELPSGNLLINPRFGFNYDMTGDRSVQLRGGTGLFSGRFPFVWIGNQVANPDFFFYNMTDPDFKFPQIWRTNIGYDRKLNNGWTISTDLIYTKDLQAQMVRNFGLITPSGTLSGVDNRPIYLDGDRAQGPFGGATTAYVFTNASKGSSWNFSMKAEKSWNDNYIMLAYNYLDAKDVASIDAEISSDAYDRNPANVQNTNVAELAPSLYGNRHRIVAAYSKKISYGNFATTISLFGELVEGGRYSYTYSGDINNDASSLNDLIYVPTDSEIDQMNFSGDASAQRAAFKSYIAQDDYLSGRRGDYAEKYGALSPWYNKLDLRILQDYMMPNGNKVTFSIDILNFGNLISSSWGVRQNATNTSLVQPIAVSVAGGTPTYTFAGDADRTFFDDLSTNSRWQMQFGLRYTF